VYYELAVRHLRRRPCIHLLLNGEDLPFDVAPSRTIYFGFDIEDATKARRELEQMIQAATSESDGATTALALAVELLPETRAQNPAERSMTAILSALQEIRGVLDQNSKPTAAEILAAVEKVGALSTGSSNRQLQLAWADRFGHLFVSAPDRPKDDDEPKTIQEFVRRKSMKDRGSE
jgi:hypothetical protein